MLEYGRIDISEGIDMEKANASKSVKFVIIGNLKILNMNHIFAMVVMVWSKKLLVLMMLLLFMLKEMLTEFIFGIMQLTKWIILIWLIKKVFCKFFLLRIKISEKTYYQRNTDVILKGAKDYYENDKEWLRQQATNKYRNLSEEEKNEEREYGKNRYHNISKEKKEKL